MFLLLCILNGFQILFRAKQLIKNIAQRSAPRLVSYEWQDVWDSMGKCLGQSAPPVFLNLTPEPVQNPDKVVKYLEKVCCHPGNSRKTQITSTCWGLAQAYRAALFDVVQYSAGKVRENTPMGTAGTPTLAMGAVATPTLVMGTVAKPEKLPMLVSVRPIQKKKYTKKSVCLVKDDDEPGHSREQEAETEPEIVSNPYP